MITDEDTNKLIVKFKTIFATKEELQQLSDNLVELINTVTASIIKELKKEVGSIGDEIKALRQENNEIFTNHEHRLDRLEDKVFS